MMEDLRQHPRYAVALECDVKRPDGTQHARSRDLSRGGISLNSAEPIQVSTEVELAIALVFGDNTFSEPLRVQALIVWCTRLGDHYQLGAKFTKVTRETRGYLDVFLKFLDAEPPEDEDEGEEEKR
jgi:hypothetical protein